MPKKIRVTVTEDDIVYSLLNRTKCPIERALQRKNIWPASVGEDTATVWSEEHIGGEVTLYALSLRAREFVYCFDHHYAVEPSTFVLTEVSRV